MEWIPIKKAIIMDTTFIAFQFPLFRPISMSLIFALDSSISSDNENLRIEDYKLVRIDYPNNSREEGDPSGIYLLKVNKKTLEQGVKYVQS